MRLLKYAFAPLIIFALVIVWVYHVQLRKLHEIDGFAEGTTYHVTWWADHRVNQVTLSKEFDTVLAKIDKEISSYRSDSDIEIFNHDRTTQWQSFPAAVVHLLTIAQTVYRDSNECYDPTIEPLFNLWGFRTHTPHIPSARQIADIKKYIGYDHVELDVLHHRIKKTIPQLAIDISSMGEGYSIWCLSRVLERHGIHNYIVEFGGDMMVKGHKPDDQKWRVAIEKPVPGELIPQRIITIENERGVSINTSGTYHRFFTKNGKTYSHILDPRTGSPVTHNLVSASVFATDPRVGDAWATAMLCMGEAEGETVAKKEGIMVFFIQKKKDGTLINTESPMLEKTKDVAIQ